MSRAVGAAFVIALAGLSACGEDSQSLFDPQPAAPKAAALVGTWEARRPVDYELRYVFRRDGTYSHSEGNRQKRKSGTYRYAINVRGTFAVRGRNLVLRPRSGTIERHDPDNPESDFKRRIDRDAQRYEWSVRGTGDRERLTLSLAGSLSVTYRRR
jgi:hypothetical protein